jgi:hypothetical protein
MVFYKSFHYSLVFIILILHVNYLRRISSISRIELTDGRGRGWGRMETNKKARSSINHSILSGLKALLTT